MLCPVLRVGLRGLNGETGCYLGPAVQVRGAKNVSAGS